MLKTKSIALMLGAALLVALLPAGVLAQDEAASPPAEAEATAPASDMEAILAALEELRLQLADLQARLVAVETTLQESAPAPSKPRAPHSGAALALLRASIGP